MPELPEVECVRRSLERGLIGRTVRAVEVRRRDIITAPGDPPGGFARSRAARNHPVRPPAPVTPADLLVGFTIERIDRLGKQLAIHGVDARPGRRSAIVVHLGMTGQLLLEGPSSAGSQVDHSHIVWTLDGPSGLLIFRDPRRFGGVRLALNAEAVDRLWADLGPDALDITADELRSALRSARRPIKSALLDQSVLAGVGNIYADEALWRARIAPGRPARGLSVDDCERLAAGIRGVLREAIDSGGSTIRDYVDGSGRAGSFQLRHAVYGRGGLPCPRCGRRLASAVVAQRTTVWCRACQRASSRTRKKQAPRR